MIGWCEREGARCSDGGGYYKIYRVIYYGLDFIIYDILYYVLHDFWIEQVYN